MLASGEIWIRGVEMVTLVFYLFVFQPFINLDFPRKVCCVICSIMMSEILNHLEGRILKVRLIQFVRKKSVLVSFLALSQCLFALFRWAPPIFSRKSSTRRMCTCLRRTALWSGLQRIATPSTFWCLRAARQASPGNTRTSSCPPWASRRSFFHLFFFLCLRQLYDMQQRVQ